MINRININIFQFYYYPINVKGYYNIFQFYYYPIDNPKVSTKSGAFANSSGSIHNNNNK